jgi:hypothetical protein
MHGTVHRINERFFLLQRQHGLLAKGVHLILGDIIQAIVQRINPLSVRELMAQRDYRFEIVGLGCAPGFLCAHEQSEIVREGPNLPVASLMTASVRVPASKCVK